MRSTGAITRSARRTRRSAAAGRVPCAHGRGGRAFPLRRCGRIDLRQNDPASSARISRRKWKCGKSCKCRGADRRLGRTQAPRAFGERRGRHERAGRRRARPARMAACAETAKARIAASVSTGATRAPCSTSCRKNSTRCAPNSPQVAPITRVLATRSATCCSSASISRVWPRSIFPQALRGANAKFERRFRRMEVLAAADGNHARGQAAGRAGRLLGAGQGRGQGRTAGLTMPLPLAGGRAAGAGEGGAGYQCALHPRRLIIPGSSRIKPSAKPSASLAHPIGEFPSEKSRAHDPGFTPAACFLLRQC